MIVFVDLSKPDPGECAGWSRTLAARAVAAGRAVVAVEGAGAGASESMLLAGARSALYAPIFARGRPAAVLCVAHRQVGGLFGEEEERLAGFLATLAGAALENAGGYAEVQTLGQAVVRGQEEERRRLALALHDGAGQVLSALAIDFDREAAKEADPTRAKRLGERSVLVNRLLEDLRRLSHDLRPAALDRLGLGPALRELGEGFAAGGLEVDVRVDPEDLGPAPEVAVHLFRVAQAALANVARHARVRRARVALVASGAAIRLEVGDDGAGFDPDSIAADAGLGLLGMRERASWLKGTFSLDSAPGRGTRIAVEVPIPAMGKWT